MYNKFRLQSLLFAAILLLASFPLDIYKNKFIW